MALAAAKRSRSFIEGGPPSHRLEYPTKSTPTRAGGFPPWGRSEGASVSTRASGMVVGDGAYLMAKVVEVSVDPLPVLPP